MKKAILAVLILALLAGGAFAQKLDARMAPGDFAARIGVGWGGASGGAELMFAQVDIADMIPIGFGAAARGYIDPGIFWGGMVFGAGGYATVHFGLTGLDLPPELEWVNNFDWYAALGLSMSVGTWGGLGISSFEGVSYFLNEKLALNAEYAYLGSFNNGSYWFSTFGVVLKF